MLQTMLNPLIDEIFGLIFNGQVWQAHTLATKLKSQEAISALDSLSVRDLAIKYYPNKASGNKERFKILKK